MLKTRALSALVFVPLFLGIAWLGGWAFDVFLALVLAFAGFEFARMLKVAGYRVSSALIISGILAAVLLRIFSSVAVEILTLPLFLVIFGMIALWQYEHDNKQAFQSLVFGLFGVFYIGVLGAYGITLNHTGSKGNLWVLVTISLVWLVDMGAYLVGSRFGKKSMLPQLSPKKTLEGFLGGTMVGLICGILIGLILNSKMLELGPVWGGLLGLMMGPVAFFGDALMSLLKRTMGVKDTGKLLPGHGGVLDRLDSMLWALVAGTYFVMIIR
ncbi:MAG: CDP-archaeol synthase [Anaerolineaceae bacterium]|nr:CDP-archaeol synthase [Anaerolineaceae bacterium]MDD4042765.1 CDP-archaeol synthase [Anaerolineaceae bacterium]MDD4578116.1 CDP-archaeol synthase [Anaerolineaceae bacterium]